VEIKFYRGDIVVCIAPGDYGKARPAVVTQSDLFNPTHSSIVICPITTHLIDAPMFRLLVDPSKQSGIKLSSQIMIDKIMVIKSDRIKQKIGKLSHAEMSKVDLALKLWLNL
jgi:mRNA interferase MazF